MGFFATGTRSAARGPAAGSRARRAGACVILCTLLPVAGWSAPDGDSQPPQQDLSSLSLEELTQIDITSFRNKVQKLSRVAGAVYVITREQIERSGMNRVPELLRVVPGLHVSQVNGGQWAVSARGTRGALQPRLLVLVDGRSIYTPIFSGVYWDMGMPLLEDIEHIEVIRGPGATVWGANAMLGVINIVTRNAKETQGTLLVAGGGTTDRAFGRLRFGGTTKRVSWRIYATAEDHSALSRADGTSADDGWNSEQAGFRMDGELANGSWMLEGAASANPGRLYNEVASLTAQGFVPMQMNMLNATGNLTGEYRHAAGKNGELRVNFYYNQLRRHGTIDRVAHERTWNADVRYDVTLGRMHEVTLGAGLRKISESVPGVGGTASFTPDHLGYENYNTFVQDEISLFGDRVLLTLGSKFEHNPFTGWGSEPSASLLWQMTPRHSVWASVARALRTPSMVERAVYTPLMLISGSPQTGGLPVQLNALGNAGFGNEAMNDFQLGYRGELSHTLEFSVSLYWDRYQHFRTASVGAPVLVFKPAPALVAPAYMSNYATGEGKGAETTLAWQRFRTWKLEASHTYAMPSTWPQAGAPYGTISIDVFIPPRNQWVLRSDWNPTRRLEADVSTFWNGRTISDSYFDRVDTAAGARVDVRLGYKLTDSCTLSLTGQNLLMPRRAEGMPEMLTGYSYIKRGLTFKTVWRF